LNTREQQVADLLDRNAIRACIEQLARGEDRRDAKLISRAYWPDSVTDYGVFRGSFDEYLAWVVPGSPSLPATQHVLGQSYIVLDGESARVETQVISYHRVDTGNEHRDSVIGGRYLDIFEQRDGEWRIASRMMVYDWSQDWGVSVDWSQGLMGQQIDSSNFVGGAANDFSRDFFGEIS
jgi:hypothetical protein